MNLEDKIFECIGFEWDKGNVEKNWAKHCVTAAECEQVFFNLPILSGDARHSQAEARYYLLGMTDSGRLLTVIFTIRKNLIRVICARDMSKKEKEAYKNL